MIKQPGRDLDALVAEKVLGYKKYQRRWESGAHRGFVDGWLDGNGTEIDGPLPRYSKDIADAWRIVEKYPMSIAAPTAPYADGEYANSNDTLWDVELTRVIPPPYDWSDIVSARAITAPHAICLAALKAVGVDVEDYEL